MSNHLQKNWSIRLIMLGLIITTANAQVVQPPNAYDEYEVVETISTQSLDIKNWSESEENVRGVEFQNLELDSNLQEADRLPETENMIYKGRAFLENRRGVIYSIVDPVAVEPRLNILTDSYALVDGVGNLKESISFYPYTNYEKSIKSYEVLIYKEGDVLKRNPVATIKGERVDFNNPITWDGKVKENTDLKDIKKLYYVFRVYDANGTYDETDIKSINLNDMDMKSFNEDNDSIKEKVYGTNDLALQNIPIVGSKIRFYGRDITPGTVVKIDNQNIELDPTGDFIYETVSDEPLKVYNFEIEKDGKHKHYPIEVETVKDYEYLVAMADFTLGENSVSGSDSILRNDRDFRASYYNAGRLTFYYKGVKDKYKITAQADTWENQIKNMFNDFHERDRNAIFRKLDRQYLPFDYGDESERYYDVESEGKAYLRVDWDKSQVLWGNYETGLDAGFFNNYNRSLYGARAEYNSLEVNPFGESKHHVEVFAANPDTSYKRDAFLGTGGSIYTLSERDIVVGSAKLTLEIKDKKTGRVIDRVALTEGSDYTINELSGRVILSDPLSQSYFTEKLTDIVKNSPAGEKNVYLLADYEFYSSADNISNLTAGGRGKTWITDNVGVGGTYVKENRKGSLTDYELKSADLTLKKSNGTYIKGEYSETEGNQLTKN
ncbi:MAG: hypothetical protein ACRC4S_07235 [Cetobacterium sp.]